jgi:hypothetical protein
VRAGARACGLNRSEQTGRRRTPKQRACKPDPVHEGDPMWRERCDQVVEMPEGLRTRAVNALSERLGLFD